MKFHPIEIDTPVNADSDKLYSYRALSMIFYFYDLFLRNSLNVPIKLQ